MQHLDGTADLVVAANHRVQLAHAGALSQVDAVFFQRFTLVFGIRTVHVLTTTHGVDGRFQRLAVHAIGLNQLAQVALEVAKRQQKQLTGDKLVATFHGFFFGALQQTEQITPRLHQFLALDLRQFFDLLVCTRQQSRHIHTRTLQQRFWPFVLAKHGRQQVRGFDVRVVLTHR